MVQLDTGLRVMNLSGVRRCLSLAAEARGACLVSADAATGPEEGCWPCMTLADGTEVRFLVTREEYVSGVIRWVVTAETGEWAAQDNADSLLHAIACAMGDAPQEAEE